MRLTKRYTEKRRGLPALFEGTLSHFQLTPPEPKGMSYFQQTIEADRLMPSLTLTLGRIPLAGALRRNSVNRSYAESESGGKQGLEIDDRLAKLIARLAHHILVRLGLGGSRKAHQTSLRA